MTRVLYILSCINIFVLFSAFISPVNSQTLPFNYRSTINSYSVSLIIDNKNSLTQSNVVFYATYIEKEVPEELKGRVMNSIFIGKFIADIADLFTVKYLDTIAGLFKTNVDSEADPEKEKPDN